MKWNNRIVATGEKPAIEFMANIRNWRTHPKAQRDALKGVLSEVGWVTGVIENVRTGMIIDGHARIEEALKLGDDTPVPFIQVDLDEAEEAKILATFDPLGSMAAADKAQLDALLKSVEIGDAAVQSMLAELAQKSGLDYGAEAVSSKSFQQEPVYKSQWMIVLTCESETQQAELLERFMREGLICRALMS